MFSVYTRSIYRPVWTRQARRFATVVGSERSLSLGDNDDDNFDEVLEGDDIDSDDDDSALDPYRSLLSFSARATWRTTPASPPKSLAHAQRRVLNETPLATRQKLTQPHLLRMVGHQKNLRERRERERRRIFQNKEYSKEDKRIDEAAQTLFYGPEQAIASVKYRLYPQFAMTKRVLSEAASLVPSFRPKRILDFGTGCGSAAAASWDVFGSSIEWFHLIDASKTMREVSETIVKELVAYRGEEESSNTVNFSSPRITTSAHMSTDSDGTFDLCLASFTLAELPNTNSILAAAALMYEKLRHGGLLVILEPGTPDGFANIRMVRSMLLDCCPEDSEDAFDIIAPCTHRKQCPMERNYGNRRERRSAEREARKALAINDDSESKESDDDNGDDEDEEDEVHGGTRIGFCSFVQTMAGGGATRRRGEKLSYLVVRKKLQDEEEEKDSDDWLAVDLPDHLRRRLRVGPDDPMHYQLQKEAEDLQAKFLESDEDDLGLEFLRGISNRQSFGRILQSPNKQRGHIIIECCVDGRIERHKVTKGQNAVAPGFYGAARKSRWGGYWIPTESTMSNDIPPLSR